MMIRFMKSQLPSACALLVLISAVCVMASPTATEQYIPLNASSLTNYNCPKTCNCVMPTNAHTKFLHAKCSNISELVEAEAILPDFPIHSIDLSYLRLTRVGQTFSKLTNLTSINLSHNELHEFGHLSRRIKRLNLKHNRITSNKLFKLPPNLKILNLQHNDISYLPRELMQLEQLTNLELSQNEINCSCETLEVRNWLQERHVFMENPVICAYPKETSGMSWLQVRQADICDKEKRGWDKADEENDLMLGDQPMETTDENDDYEKEELGSEYMRLDTKFSTSSPNSARVAFDDVEGSGDSSHRNMEIKHETPTPLASTQVVDDEGDDGSGSGGGILDVGPSAHFNIITDDKYEPGSIEAGNHDDVNDYEDKLYERPVTEDSHSPAIFDKFNLGIFDDKDSDQTASSPQPVTEDGIIPVVHHDLESVVTDESMHGNMNEAEAIKHANAGDKDYNKATYFLLGVIALLVVGLLFFVGMKRCNKKRQFDAEAQRQTELLDMDKKNLGKPLQRNGTEHAPLIGEKTLVDSAKPMNGSGKKPYDSNDAKDGAEQQLMNGNGKHTPLEHLEETTAPPSNEQHPHEYHPITPRYPTPKSPRASKYAQYPPPPSAENNNNNTMHNDAYLPSSPKSGRYSPVYSPETGHVKIKLTETPRPKTPMLVTRSKSNAGDMITTPVHLNNVH